MRSHNKSGKSCYLHIPSEYRPFYFDLVRDCADDEECSMSEIVTRTFVDSVLPHDENLRRYALIPYTGGSVIDSVRQVLNDSWLGQSAPLGNAALGFADRYFPLASWICPGQCNISLLADGRVMKEHLSQLLVLSELSASDKERGNELLALLNGPVSIRDADAVFSCLHHTYGDLSSKAQPTACGIAAMILSGVCSFLGPEPSDYDDCDDRLAWCSLFRDIENAGNGGQQTA